METSVFTVGHSVFFSLRFLHSSAYNIEVPWNGIATGSTMEVSMCLSERQPISVEILSVSRYTITGIKNKTFASLAYIPNGAVGF